jgi:tRNA pseudouridine synthase 10
LFIQADGGLPIKRFVNGDNVSPSISQIIGISCKSQEFDFLDILIQ